MKLPPGYSVSWSGQFEFLERAKARLAYVVPLTLTVIFVLLYLAFRRIDEALLIMLAVPFALVGGYWLLWALGLRDIRGHGRRLHRARGRRGGVRRRDAALPAARVGGAPRARTSRATRATLLAAIEEGAVLRVRPKAMTVAVIMAGLLPIMLSEGTGAEVMQRIAAPMVGGMITAPLLSMLVLPAALSASASSEQKEIAKRYIEQLNQSKAFPAPIVTQVAALEKFYPAEDYHQNYLALHPEEPYIVYNDLPKLVALKKEFPDRYK